MERSRTPRAHISSRPVKQLPHPLHHTILLRVVRMVLARDLQQARKRLIVRIHLASDHIRNVLVDEHDGDVFALRGEGVEGGFDGAGVGFGVYDQVVLLAVRWVGDVPDSGEEHACDGVL